MKTKKNLWFKERFTKNELHSHRLKKYLVSKQTKFQKAIIAESCSFGRCLILDGELQSAKLDEFIYHEVLVHPALIIHPNPEKVLIMGAGEGAALREVLKYKSVKKAITVDIDSEVVNFCKKYLHGWHKGSFENSRSELIITDARKYVIDTPQKFDCIISDLPSPIENGPAYLLYTIEFYSELVKKLKNSGIFVLQAGSGSLLQIELHKMLYSTLKKKFKNVYPYYAYIPSFDVPWAFLLCSNTISPLELTEKQINSRLTQRLSNPTLRFYDGSTHIGLFNIPLYLRSLLSKEKRIITEKKPMYFFK